MSKEDYREEIVLLLENVDDEKARQAYYLLMGFVEGSTRNEQ